ncbi:MAG: 50S ribosomal protein L11 methyltransferase, partial [Pseudomonadales bacterium]
WERSWLNDFEPLQFGKKLWICPSWYEPPEPNAINIALDPGLAFGTGTHQTTALCLEWLEQASLKDKTIIDYGCGSGILAIAALLLGAKQAICVDNDPQALAATLSNAAQNNISDTNLVVCKPEK